MVNFKGIVTTRGVLAVYTSIMIIIVYLPLFMMMIFSFKSGAAMTFPFEGFSFKWYIELINKPYIIKALTRSLVLGFVVGIVTMVITISAALGLREPFRGRDVVFYLIMLGLIVPGLVYGVGSLMMYKKILMIPSLSLWTAIPVQTLWAVPWALLLTLARFDPNLSDYEAVARSLGANGWTVFKRVTYPNIAAYIILAALFGFTFSFSELLRTVFVLGGPPTLPVFIYTWLSAMPLSPEYYAIGTLTLFFAFGMLLVMRLLMAKARGRKVKD